ncbi:MAG: FAD-dependent oxidoreductase [marine benthic group bacterium]|nr:FAD-dependent oxidoreductase [Gemmatimonadota bacterium]
MRRQVAVIGAGVAGLAAARSLADEGLDVEVFEKSRGFGGRAATRRTKRLQFDHGAQYFTARSPRFQDALAPLFERGLVEAWSPRIVRLASDGTRGPAPDSDRFVGVPGMSSLGRALAGDLPVARSVQVEQLQRERNGEWTLLTAEGDRTDPFEAVIVTCPAPQAADLLDSASRGLAAVCRSAVMLPCWAVMVAFESPLEFDFDAAFVTDGMLAWVSREASKPGRSARPECWTLHGSPEWSAARLEDEPGRVARALLGRFFELGGTAPRNPIHLVAHRWRYARSAEPRTVSMTLDSEARIAIAGDWTVGDRLEGAWQSGIEAAEAIAGLPGRG